MKFKVLVILLLIISVCFIQSTGQEKNKKESAAAVLEKTLKDSGIEAAETKFTAHTKKITGIGKTLSIHRQ